MSRIFISYRREDSAGHAGRIRAWLQNRLGSERIFFDLHGIEPGEDFVQAITRAINDSHLVLVVIGRDWATAADAEGRRRLDLRNDLVRSEISTAIERGVRVVPILVGGATMPDTEILPASLAGLCRLNALEISDRRFEPDMESLAAYIAKWDVAQAPPEKPSREGLGPDTLKKVCLIGAAGVGKTSLVRRFVESVFSESYLTTVGVHISKKRVAMGSVEVTLLIWDIAGEEHGVTLHLPYVRGAQGIILVADGTRRQTIDDAERLRSSVSEALGFIPSVLAINKVDLYDEWQISTDQLSAFQRAGQATFTTSAKTGTGVDLLFTHLVRSMNVHAAYNSSVKPKPKKLRDPRR